MWGRRRDKEQGKNSRGRSLNLTGLYLPAISCGDRMDLVVQTDACLRNWQVALQSSALERSVLTGFPTWSCQPSETNTLDLVLCLRGHPPLGAESRTVWTFTWQRWEIWLILPVVVCLSQRLSHASLSTCTVNVWNCKWLITPVTMCWTVQITYMDNCGNSRANTCT